MLSRNWEYYWSVRSLGFLIVNHREKIMPSIPSCLEIIFRALFVTSAMGATSFVVGSVVSYQYHLVLIHFKWEDDEAVESKYRKLARKVYVVGFVIGLIVAMGIDHM